MVYVRVGGVHEQLWVVVEHPRGRMGTAKGLLEVVRVQLEVATQRNRRFSSVPGPLTLLLLALIFAGPPVPPSQQLGLPHTLRPRSHHPPAAAHVTDSAVGMGQLLLGRVCDNALCDA